MKTIKCLLALFFATSIGLSYSQTYQPLTNTTLWTFSYVDFGGSGNFWIEFNSDTIINGISYKSYKTFAEDSTGTVSNIIREDTVAKQIYYYDGFSELLVADFGMLLGDQISFGNGIYELVDITTINTHDGPRNKYTLHRLPPASSAGITWIEGVSLGDWVFRPNFLSPSDPAVFLKCSFESATHVYDSGLGSGTNVNQCFDWINVSIPDADYIADVQLFPNPTNGILNINTSEQFDQIEIYSMKGLLVEQLKFESEVSLTHLPKGVYLINLLDEQGNRFAKKLILQ